MRIPHICTRIGPFSLDYFFFVNYHISVSNYNVIVIHEEEGGAMIKYVGCADMPGICLKYYVFGNRRKGYGIKIIRTEEESVGLYVSRNLLRVLDLANQLCRCKVFPSNLCEILEDMNYDGVSD